MQRLLTILFLAVAVAANAATLKVGASHKYKTIRQAIADAADGDSILIYAGVYKEQQLIIEKQLFIRGIDWPVLDGEQKYEIVTIRKSGTLVEGILFRHSGRSSYNDIAALRIADCRNVIVRNNQFENSFFGIYSQHATAAVIINNKLRSDAKDEISSGNGIHCWKSDRMFIAGNSITGHRDGIYFEFVTNSTIKQNISTQNVRYGLHFMFSNTNTYLSNTFKDNGAGVAVMYSKGISMYNNTFSDNWGTAAYGILMKDITDSHVQGNHFLRNTVAVMMEGSNRIQLLKNTFEQNGWALKIQASCMENKIAQNNFKANSFDVATNGELMLNLFQRNYWDKYEGYDLNRNGIGDVPFRPVSMYAMISERNSSSMMLYRSFIVGLLDKAERMLPVLTPVDLKDDEPSMKPIKF